MPRVAVCDRFRPRTYADVAQLVARNLAKVQVAGSNPVVRSQGKFSYLGKARSDGREARLGTANPATRVQIPFRPPNYAAGGLANMPVQFLNLLAPALYGIRTASPRCNEISSLFSN